MAKFKEYGSWHLERMRDPIEAAAFFKAAIEEAIKSKDRDLYLEAARDIMKAGGPTFLHAVIESIKPTDMGQMMEKMVTLDVNCRDRNLAHA